MAATIVDTIIEGNIWQSEVTVTLEATGDLVDPTIIALNYALNGDPTTKVTLTYVSATVPAPGVVARTALGTFVSQVNLTGISGTIERYWKSTGVAQAASPTGAIVVPALPF
jgi:hypothetical protein